MQCGCERTPGYKEETWGNFSSGLTQQRQDAAVRCGYRGIVNRYPGGGASCPKVYQPAGNAVPESVLLAKREADRFTNCGSVIGKVALTGQQYTRSLEKSVAECVSSQLSGDQRFAQYERKFPVPCPPTPAEQLNSTLPKPTFQDCQPSRFF